MPEPENPFMEGWGREPLVQTQDVGRPGLRPSAEGPLLHKASQEEKQQGQEWDGRLATFVASNGEPDRNGNILDPQGWDLQNYRRNPVVLFAHNWNLPPVGKALSIAVEGQLLKATVQFAPTPLGQELALLNADNYLRAISVGARPIDWEVRRHPEHGYPIGIHCHRQELVELSIVSVPANPSALHASLDPPTIIEAALITSLKAAEKDIPIQEVHTLLQSIYAHLKEKL